MNYITQEPNGDFLVTGNGYVTTYDPTGTTVLSNFGNSDYKDNSQHTGGPYQFFFTGQAVQGSDGTIYTLDPGNSIESTNPQGYLQNATTIGGSLQAGGDEFFLVGSTLYFQGGPFFNSTADTVQSISLSNLQAYLTAPNVPDNALGWGAGLATVASANYFGPGSSPGIGSAGAVYADFDPWWLADASHLQLSYAIENDTSIASEVLPTPTNLNLPTTASGLADIQLTVPPSDQLPGPYMVQASLYDTSSVPPTLLGTTCMPYTVGQTGDGLNLAALPGSLGAGGPTDPRGVALNAQLGLNGFRGVSVNWSTFLPDCSPSAPTAATCGPSAMTFANAPTDYFVAAAEALADNVTYWVQVSTGDSTSMALVTNGWWEGDVAALVSYYSSPPPGCGSCAPVTKWEPWNEPNNTGWGNASLYYSKVLQPFYAAVKSVEPGSGSTVIGGSSLGVPISWWQQLITAGGLSDMDVAAIHPYTGSNDSFEEDGTPSQIQALQALLGSTPLWITELGWWSDARNNFAGDSLYDYLAQANNVAREFDLAKGSRNPDLELLLRRGELGQ